MAQISKIQWTDFSWNPWQGCHKISLGCKYCYMYRNKNMYGQIPHIVVKSKPLTFNKPLRIKEPSLIFTCSWSDWFIEEADAWRDEAWDIIRQTPQHTYQILTKRPERIAECLPDDWGEGYSNVWLGVSVESMDVLDRIYDLIQIKAKVRFLSIEPLISPVSLPMIIMDSKISWVIIGAESGNNNGKYRYRLCELYWITRIVEQCKAAEIPVFVKQLGTHLSKELKLKDRHGGDINEWPKHLKIRQMPQKEEFVKTDNK